MRKTTLMMLRAMVSSSAAADWVAAGRNASDTSFYANPATTSKTGELVKMCLLYDYTAAEGREVNGKRFLSTKIQVEYNCKDKQRRELYSTWYSGQRGNGDTVYTFGVPGNWAPVMSGSLGEIRWKLACEQQTNLALNAAKS